MHISPASLVCGYPQIVDEKAVTVPCQKGKANMSNVLILSCQPILKKEEEEALAKDNVRVTTLTNYNQDMSKEINGDYDYILLGNALGSTDIYKVRHVGIISGK